VTYLRAAKRKRYPNWAHPFLAGRRMSAAQAFAAHAAYYGVDGSCDLDCDAEERMPLPRKPMQSYASRTGTQRNLQALRHAGWRLLVSAAGVLRHEGMPYALDNGAWSAFTQGRPFDARAFWRALEQLGERADWVVIPDIVAGGLHSLEFSLQWLHRLRGLPARQLIAVQDGMTPDDVREFLGPMVGIFVGGTTEFKEQTMHQWGTLARRRCCYLHVGRVNSVRRIRLCAAAGADSIDGTSATRFSKTVPRLDRARRQEDLFAATGLPLEEALI
jgi:hypothetical protein